MYYVDSNFEIMFNIFTLFTLFTEGPITKFVGVVPCRVILQLGECVCIYTCIIK